MNCGDYPKDTPLDECLYRDVRDALIAMARSAHVTNEVAA